MSNKRANVRVAERLRKDGRRHARDATIERVLLFVDRLDGRLPRMADLCAAAGVSERTLRSIFVEVFGLAPYRYLRIRRPHVIRAALAAADPHSQTVRGIAKRLGYTDAGRMASEYRSLFGEYPRATLSRQVMTRVRDGRRSL